MLNIDVNSSHTFVKYKIDNDEQFARELADSIDLIISEIIKSKKELSGKQNIERAVQYRNDILQKTADKKFSYPECYTDKELIIYEKKLEK
ncbi:MAG: hypothetical protein ACLUWE_03695 [Lachnospira sp.]